MRERAWRRAQTERYKNKSERDYRNLTGSAPLHPVSDTRHSLDCGHRCFMCSGPKLLHGRKRERLEARLELRSQDG